MSGDKLTSEQREAILKKLSYCWLVRDADEDDRYQVFEDFITAHTESEDEKARELTEAEKNYPLTRVFPTCYNCKHVIEFEKFGKQGLKCGLKLFQISTVLVNPFCGDWLQQEG